jgi:CheY-like chemotaxis protein
MVRELARYALLQHGYTVLEAQDGQEALTMAQKHKDSIDLIVTDVVLPGGMSGRDVADQVTFIHPESKVLYMSGYADDAIIQHGVLAPDIAFLQKPFTPNTLARKVRNVLDE